jgi:hypothetical protein
MIGYALGCTLLLFLFLVSIILRGDNREDFWFREGGVIESASVSGYFLCIAFMIYKRNVANLKHVFLLIIFFMLRELDFHERFTTMGIFKSKFFMSEDVPLIEKFVGAMIILLLLYVSISLLYRYSKDFLVGLKKRSAVSVGTLLTITLLVVSKSIDGLDGKLKGFGIAISEQMSMHAEALEEILELGIPIIILLTLNAHCKDIKVEERF